PTGWSQRGPLPLLLWRRGPGRGGPLLGCCMRAFTDALLIVLLDSILDFSSSVPMLWRMRIHFLVATSTTTGSMFLLELNGQQLLLECGLFQGKRAESIERNRQFPFDPRQIDAVLLSHAHIDHCGNLPNLCRQGFRGNIYCTFA